MLLSFVAEGLIISTPPKGKPVILGTSDYSNILFGKIQRAASLFGTNLAQPFSILSQGDSLSKLDKCLWNKFSMANSGPAGVEEESDIKLPLTSWIPQGNLTRALIFVDAASCISESGGDGGNPLASLFLFGSKKKEIKSAPKSTAEPTVSEINEGVLEVAVARKCAHIYVLSDDASLSKCIETLGRCAKDTPCTIVALEPKVVLATTSGWVSSRPQDLEGELTGPVGLSSLNSDEKPAIAIGSTTFPVEDAAEVMLQVALRTDRSPEKRLRVVRLKVDGELQERLNADYFTLTGGKKAKARAGTVQSVSSWETVLSPVFGPVIGRFGIEKR